MNLTALLLTYNEEANLERTLSRLTWVPRIVILDSGSTDQTREIAQNFPNVVWYQREFDNHTNQWNYGLTETRIDTEWVLALDADYQIPEALAAEIQQIIQTDSQMDAFWMNFVYAIDGKLIRSGIYPPVRALFRREKAFYEDHGHTQKVAINGKTGFLTQKAIHDDRKSMRRWLQSQWKYAQLEAKKLESADLAQLRKQDRIRRKRKITPFLVFIYCILLRSGWKDGYRGWQYAWQRTIAEILIQYCLLETRKTKNS